MTTVVSGSSQFNMGDSIPENYSNSNIKPSSSVTLPVGSWVDGSLLYWCFGLEFLAVVVCAVVLKVGSSTFVAWPYLHHSFDLSDT